jgi:hypothetical protein
VGVFPARTAPCGPLDMAGNVWEWTSSLFKGYPYRLEDGREDPASGGNRVPRGGSWHDFYQRRARVSARSTYAPDYFFSIVGFRLVVAPVRASGCWLLRAEYDNEYQGCNELICTNWLNPRSGLSYGAVGWALQCSTIIVSISGLSNSLHAWDWLSQAWE